MQSPQHSFHCTEQTSFVSQKAKTPKKYLIQKSKENQIFNLLIEVHQNLSA